MTDPITVVMADDHPVFRRGLAEVLEADASIRIVGEAADGESALELVRRHRPRIALLDIELPRTSGLVVAEAVRREQLPTSVVLLTMYRDPAMLRRALELGARGYVLKDSAATDIIACLHLVDAGRAYVSAAMSSELVDRRAGMPTEELAALAELTPAERRVLGLIARDLTSTSIASRLGLSPKTVENHRSHICRKLGLHGPQALLRFVLEHKSLLE